MPAAAGDFDVSMDELRAVARFVTESAEEVLPLFERATPDDDRPRAAVDAAWEFVNGGKRTQRLRVASLAAHRAAAEANDEEVRLAARCAGDAASAAYLHPIAKASQVGHILRAAASAARIAEICAAGDPAAGELSITQARDRASPVLIDVISRYPSIRPADNRVAQLMSRLDSALRTCR